MPELQCVHCRKPFWMPPSEEPNVGIQDGLLVRCPYCKKLQPPEPEKVEEGWLPIPDGAIGVLHRIALALLIVAACLFVGGALAFLLKGLLR